MMCSDAEELTAGRILHNDGTSLLRITSYEVADYRVNIIGNSLKDYISEAVVNGNGDERERSIFATHVNDSTSILGITCAEISDHVIKTLRIINETRHLVCDAMMHSQSEILSCSWTIVQNILSLH
jgi:hypothetical protein